jgi:hypothetical protein
MYRHVVWFVLILVLMGVVSAADANSGAPLQAAVNAQVEQANRFLSAEVAKQIQIEQEKVMAAVNANNDANFQTFDGRMALMLLNVRQQVIVGGIGAILIANAIVGLFLLRAWRRYSYEYYQEQIIKKQTQEIGNLSGELEKIQQMQQQSWYPQPELNTISAKMGQVEAMNMTQMNQWQMQPAYAGSWQPPQQDSQQRWGV